MSRHNLRVSIVAIAVFTLAFIGGCKSEHDPSGHHHDGHSHSNLPSDHPANPQAQEAPYTPLRDVFKESRPLAVNEADEGDGGLSHEAHKQGGKDAHAYDETAERKAATPDHDHEKDAAPTGDKQAPGEREVVELNAEMRGQVDRILRAFVALAEMLAKDRHEGAAEQVMEIHKAAHALDEVENDKVQDLAGRIAEAAHGESDDLKAARATFKALSAPMIELVHIAPPAHKGAPTIREVYCPMAKASWLQTAEKVANPYFGSEMPNCGKVTRTIKARGNGHEGEHKHKD